MNYEPQQRPAHGFQPFSRASMSIFCDVCSKPRNKGDHGKCAKTRQAAGFIIQEKRRG
ncbi:hypothetical protein [Pseudomonas sp. NUPR-001]|uniref:hypothetical protein n=1 Tax=Pseudomonas sp. NUPR-001 TaxID=3416058 RepID=UPI003F9A9A8D